MPSGVYVDVLIAEADDIVAPVDPADDGKVLARNSSTGKYEHVEMTGGGGVSLSDANTWLASQSFQDSGVPAVTDAELLVEVPFVDLAAWNNDFSGFSVVGGQLVRAPGNYGTLSQTVALEAGRQYQISFTVSGRTAGTAFLFATQMLQTQISGNGTRTISNYVSASSVTFVISVDTEFDGVIETVSFAQVLESNSPITIIDGDGNEEGSIYPLESGGGIAIKTGVLELNASTVEFSNLADHRGALPDNATWSNHGFLVVGDPAFYHNDLTNLNFDDSGHLGFAGTAVENTFTEDQTFEGDVVMSGLPTSDPGSSGVWLSEGLMVIGDAPDLGTSDHAALDNLGYASSGHTGFAGVDVENEFSEVQTFAAETTLFPNLFTDADSTPPNGLWNDGGTARIVSLDAEILLNGNFETGDPPSDWFSSSVAEVVDTDVHSDGSQALRLELFATDGGVYQGVTLVPDTRYFVTVWAKAISGSCKLRVFDGDLSTDVGSVTSALSDDYHRLSIDFVASSSYYQIWLQGVTDTDIVLFDDASLRAVLTAPDGGITSHADLDDLDYASSGHTGFAGTGVSNLFGRQQRFAASIVDASLDAEQLSDGTFPTLDNWNDDASGWNVVAGGITHTPGAPGTLYQDVILPGLGVYVLTISVTGLTTGTVQATNISALYVDASNLSSIGYADNTSDTITISVSDDFDGKITSISLKQTIDNAFPANLVLYDAYGGFVAEIRAFNGSLLIGNTAGPKITNNGNMGYGHYILDAISSQSGNAAFGTRAGAQTITNGGLFVGNNAGADLGAVADNPLHIGNGGDIISGTMDGGNAATQALKFHAARINVADLPTSSAGLTTGDLWNDLGTLKIA